MLTLICSAFWNTIGISTHNHDLDSDPGVAIVRDAPSGSPLPVVSRTLVIATPSDSDTCPGCSYNAACVSGALAPLNLPQPPTTSAPVALKAISLCSTTLLDISSRGPPTA